MPQRLYGAAVSKEGLFHEQQRASFQHSNRAHPRPRRSDAGLAGRVEIALAQTATGTVKADTSNGTVKVRVTPN